MLDGLQWKGKTQLEGSEVALIEVPGKLFSPCSVLRPIQKASVSFCPPGQSQLIGASDGFPDLLETIIKGQLLGRASAALVAWDYILSVPADDQIACLPTAD